METLMMVPATSGSTDLVADQLSRAVAAHLARYKGQSRMHTASDLRSYLGWCAARRLDPLSVSRVHVELWIRWMQEIRRLQPATVSRRVSVVAGFYRTCVIDGVLTASPAEHVRRPRVSAESPTLGLTHLQFEALLTAARLSPNRNDFALVTMLGLLGLRIFEARAASITDLGEEHGHRVLRVRGKGRQDRPRALAPRGQPRHRDRPQRPEHGSDPAQPTRHPHGPAPRPPAALPGRHRRSAPAEDPPAYAAAHLRHTMLDAGVDLRDVQIAARHADPRTTMRYDRARKNLDRHPNYILAAYMASGT